MHMQLPPDLSQEIQRLATRFGSPGEVIRHAIHALVKEEKRKPVWEAFAEVGASLAETVWQSLSPDASEQHDHYIYGTPKRPA
jgi:hypothetical protein